MFLMSILLLFDYNRFFASVEKNAFLVLYTVVLTSMNHGLQMVQVMISVNVFGIAACSHC